MSRMSVTIDAVDLWNLRFTGNQDRNGGWQIEMGRSGDVWAYLSWRDAKQIARAFAALAAKMRQADRSQSVSETVPTVAPESSPALHAAAAAQTDVPADVGTGGGSGSFNPLKEPDPQTPQGGAA